MSKNAESVAASVDGAFKRYFRATAATKPVTAALTFDDPTKCQYCGKDFQQSTVEGRTVFVCWQDRNVVVPFTK